MGRWRNLSFQTPTPFSNPATGIVGYTTASELMKENLRRQGIRSLEIQRRQHRNRSAALVSTDYTDAVR